MRLHEQLGGEDPDQEVEDLLADWRRAREADCLCPDCGVTTDDGERCGECLSYLAGFYTGPELAPGQLIPEGDER